MGNNPEPQLYNLSIDPSEKNNVAKDHPDKVKTLSALLEEVKKRKEPTISTDTKTSNLISMSIIN